ncbi:MAG: hypothetical protein AB1813_18225 [Verrucomicrobiota bacterium]
MKSKKHLCEKVPRVPRTGSLRKMVKQQFTSWLKRQACASCEELKKHVQEVEGQIEVVALELAGRGKEIDRIVKKLGKEKDR